MVFQQIVTPLTHPNNSTLQHALKPVVGMKEDILSRPEDKTHQDSKCSQQWSKPGPEECSSPNPASPLHHDPLHLLLSPAAVCLLLLFGLFKGLADVRAEYS